MRQLKWFVWLATLRMLTIGVWQAWFFWLGIPEEACDLFLNDLLQFLDFLELGGLGAPSCQIMVFFQIKV